LVENQRAIELDPLSPSIAMDKAITLVWQGKYDNARDLLRRAMEIDPSFYMSHAWVGWTYLQAGSPQQAIPELEQAYALDAPPWVASWLGYAYGAAGNRDKAHRMIEELKHRSVHGHVAPFSLALVYLGMGDREHALDKLEEACAANSQMLLTLKMDRMLDPLRSLPRFVALLKKVHLDE